MSHVRGPRFTFRGQRYALDLLWIGPALILSIPTGWIIGEFLWPTQAATFSIVGAGAAPILLAVTIAILEYIRLSVARMMGRPLPRRRVGPLGSVDDSYQTAGDPGFELRRELAVVGVSIAFGALLLAPSVLASGLDHVHPLMIPGIVVLGISLLNVLPTFPLAGGRVLRAVFWYLHERHATGTRAAFLYSQLVASASIGFGSFFLIWKTETLLPGLWGLFLGVLVLRSSRRELQRATIIDRASNVRAADALSGLNPTIRAAATLAEAIDIMLEQRANGPALVRDRNVYTGALDLSMVRDIPRRQWASIAVSEVVRPFDQLTDSPPGADLLTIFRALDAEDGTTVIVRERNNQIVGLVDHTMDPRVLLRRGMARTIPGTRVASSTHEGPGTS